MSTTTQVLRPKHVETDDIELVIESLLGLGCEIESAHGNWGEGITDGSFTIVTDATDLQLAQAAEQARQFNASIAGVDPR